MLINQTLDSEWFRVLAFIGTIAFALSGVVLAYAGQYSLFGAVILATLPALGGGVVRDLLLQRDPLGIVRNPEALLIVFGTVLAGMVVIKAVSHVRAPPLAKYLQSHARLGSRLIEAFDAVALAAFTVVGVVVVLDTSARPLWLWGPIAAVLTGSFGGLMRDLLRHDRVAANLRGELYPEIARRLGAGLCHFPGMGRRTIAAGRDQAGRDRDDSGRIPDENRCDRPRRQRMVVRLNVSPMLMTKGRLPRRQCWTRSVGTPMPAR